MPQLPRHNPVRSSVYPELPTLKPALCDTDRPPATSYARPERQALAEEVLPCQQLLGTDVSSGSRPPPPPVATLEDPLRSTPPAALARPVTAPLTSVAPAETEGLLGLLNPRIRGAFRPPEDTCPKGPIGEVDEALLMKPAKIPKGRGDTR